MITVAAAVSIVTVMVGLVTNVASSQRNWPRWLRPIQHHPWLSFVLLGVVVVILTAVFSIVTEAGLKRQDRDSDLPSRLPDSRTLIGDVPSGSVGYRERKDLLAKLERPPRGRGASRIQSVTGMLGVGKTALAAEYARARHADGWRLVAWINASDTTAILSGLAQVASKLGLRPEGLDAGAAGRAVRRRLETDGDRCLLVFNDAADLDAISPFLPTVGKAQVLITTNRRAAANLGATVKVDVFTPQEALAFLHDRTNPQTALAAAQLAAELGYLPLALAQAVAVIEGEGLNYETYLERLHSRPIKESLNHIDGDHYLRGTAAAIMLSLKVVAERDGTGVSERIMEIISVLSPGGAPRLLLQAVGRSDELPWNGPPDGISDIDVDKALGRLVESSLLTSSMDRDHVRAHRLVTRVVRDKMTGGRLETVCMAVGKVLIEQAKSVRKAWKQSAVRDLAEQIKAVLEHMASLCNETNNDLTRCMLKLRLERARFLDDLGDLPAQAVQDGDQLLKDAEHNLGDDDPITLTCRHNLAIAYQQAGQDSKAIAEYEKNLADRVRILGVDHPDTLASRNNLATAYQDAGRIEEAVALYEKNLADRVRILGVDHSDTRASRNNLATAYQDAGHVWQAIPLHEKNLDLEALTPWNEPPMIPDGMNRVSRLRPLHERTRADGNRTIRAGHPDFLGYQNNLATAYLEAGRAREATTLLEHTCRDKVQILGPNHPSTFVSQNNLAITCLEIGRARQAITLLDKARTDSGHILGTSHRITRTIEGNLAAARATTTMVSRLRRILT